MGGSPPDTYNPHHMAFQLHMLQGSSEYVASTTSGAVAVQSSTAPDDSLVKCIWDLLTVNTCGDNPYHGVTLYSATSSNQPYQSFVDSVSTASCYLNSLYTYSSTGTPGWLNYFNSLYTTASCLFPAPSYTTSLLGVERRIQGRMLRELGKLNAAFSAAHAVNTSSRVIAHALMYRDATREMDAKESEFELEQARMEFERHKYVLEAARTTAAALVQADLEKFQKYGAIAELYKVTSELKTNFERMYIDDSVQMDLQDALWDANLFRYLEQGLGSLGGLNALPEKPSPILQLLHLVTGAASIIAGL